MTHARLGIVIVAAVLGVGAALGAAACGEDRGGDVQFEGGTGTNTTGTGTEGTVTAIATVTTPTETTPTDTTPTDTSGNGGTTAPESGSGSGGVTVQAEP